MIADHNLHPPNSIPAPDPASTGPEASASGETLAQSRPDVPPAVRSVLLVEDDAALRALLHLVLTTAGYHVHEAADGNQALAQLGRITVDWVVTDIIMPDQEGLGLIRLIRQRHPGVRIIAMSGGGRGMATDYLRTARLLGASHILQKPFEFSDLLSLLGS